jgi:hypothetical protein
MIPGLELWYSARGPPPQRTRRRHRGDSRCGWSAGRGMHRSRRRLRRDRRLRRRSAGCADELEKARGEDAPRKSRELSHPRGATVECGRPPTDSRVAPSAARRREGHSSSYQAGPVSPCWWRIGASTATSVRLSMTTRTEEPPQGAIAARSIARAVPGEPPTPLSGRDGIYDRSRSGPRAPGQRPQRPSLIGKGSEHANATDRQDGPLPAGTPLPLATGQHAGGAPDQETGALAAQVRTR